MSNRPLVSIHRIAFHAAWLLLASASLPARAAEPVLPGETVEALARVADDGPEAALPMLQECLADARRTEDFSTQGALHWAIGHARLELGQREEAVARAAASLAIWERSDSTDWPKRARRWGELARSSTHDRDLLRSLYLEELAKIEERHARLADGARHVEEALSLIEGRKDQEDRRALLVSQRGRLLSYQLPESGMYDLEQLVDLTLSRLPAGASADTRMLAYFLTVVPGLATAINQGEFLAALEPLREWQARFPDKVPTLLTTMLEMIRLMEEERPAEAAALCEDLRTQVDRSSRHAPRTLRGIDLMCISAEFLAAFQENRLDPETILEMLLTIRRGIVEEGGPMEEPLLRMADVAIRIARAPDRPEEWPSTGELHEAVDSLDRVLEQAYPAGMRSGLDSVFGMYVHMAVLIRSEAGDAAGSFELAERARARDFLDRLAEPTSEPPTETGGGSRIGDLMEKSRALGEAIGALDLDTPDSPLLAGLLDEYGDVGRTIRGLIERPRLERPIRRRAETLSAAEIQARLEPGTSLVAFMVLEPFFGEVLAWVVDREGITRTELTIRSEELADAVGRARLDVESRQLGRESMDAVYHAVWAPLGASVKGERVVVIPHGSLQELPFAALRHPESGRWLIERHALLQAPSATAWARLAERPVADGGTPLLVGDPAGDLKGSKESVASLGSLWQTRPLLGDEATEQVVRERAPGSGLIHLSTHGLASTADPDRSHLQFARTGGSWLDTRRDGRLELREVTDELDLRGTGLVVLATCGGGEGWRTKGDEVASLGRAFLLAGARSTITATWDVDDRATGVLMVDLHRQLAAGVDAAEALRRAQLAALSTPGRSDPWFWAGFAMHGASGAVRTRPTVTPAQPSPAIRVEGGEPTTGERGEPWR